MQSGAGFLRFAVRRLLLLVPQLFAVVTIAFLLIRVIPGDPAAAFLGATATQQSLHALRHQFGLDQPLLVQYGHFLTGLLHWDLGSSWRTSQPVMQDINQRLPITLQLITSAMVLSILIAIPLGVLAASARQGRVAKSVRSVAGVYGLIAGAMPEFWLGLLLILLFFVHLNVVPGPVGLVDPTLQAPPSRTGFVVIDAILAGQWDILRNVLMHLLLPVATLTFTTTAPLLRMTMVEMGRALSSDYAQHARALGISERKVYRYALQSAGSPLLTLIGVLYAFLIGGAVLVENIFSLGGFGQYAVQSVLASDYPGLLGFVLVAGVFAFVVYLVLDLVQGALDPRAR